MPLKPSIRTYIATTFSQYLDFRGDINESFNNGRTIIIQRRTVIKIKADKSGYCHSAILKSGRYALNAAEIINKIKNLAPNTKIVAISSSEDTRNIKKILSCGVKGYIPKRSDSNILSGALKLILDGGTYIPPAMLDNGIDYNGSSHISNPLKKNLTNRQSQVLDLIAQGKSNKQIAYDMGVSEATVKLHINALLRSLKVNNRTQAVITAQKMGLI